jgi:hypothetical protein
LRRHRAQPDHQSRLHAQQFRGKPLATGRLFRCIGALVQLGRAARLVLEMFHSVGEIKRLAIKARVGHGAIE